MISWGGWFSAVLHAYGIFMFNFFGINIQLRGSSLSKEDYHKFVKLQTVLLMLLMTVIISSSCSYTTGRCRTVTDCTKIKFWWCF